MTAPHPGLTDLIAAHTLVGPYVEDWFYHCKGCDWTSTSDMKRRDVEVAHIAHVALVVEQHTKAIVQPIYDEQQAEIENSRQEMRAAHAATLRARDRAEKAEAMIARVRAVEAEYLDPEDADIECREDVWRFIRDLRAALEGAS